MPSSPPPSRRPWWRRPALLCLIVLPLAVYGGYCYWGDDIIDALRMRPVPWAADDGSALLDMPPREDDDAAPDEGWCGETALQEILLFYGGYFPQFRINQLGQPDHPDLYERDIPVALANLNMRFERWPNRPAGMPAFMDWIRARVKAGVPVLVGTKVYPTEHEDWDLDHFVNVVGFDKDSFTLNTTWGRRSRKSVQELTSARRGLAFWNHSGRYFGIAVLGPALSADELPVRLLGANPDRAVLEVTVRCDNLDSRATYDVYRSESWRSEGTLVHSFTAASPSYSFSQKLDKETPAVFRVKPGRASTSRPSTTEPALP